VKRIPIWLILVTVLAAGAAYLWLRPGPPPPPPAPAPVAEKPSEPLIRHRVAEAPDAPPLPSLNESDIPLRAALAGVVGEKPLGQFLVPNEIIRHMVVTVDNLPRRKVAPQMRPVKGPKGEPKAAEIEGNLTWSETNYARYSPLVTALEATPMDALSALYLRYYPRFQEAYEQLGNPGGYFNDRLVEAIDLMLATPEVKGPIRLEQPGVLYTYADAELESLSAGQKLLLRMGPKNAAVVKSKLRELRAAVTAQPPPKAP
jgi:hypothetical protein